MGAGISVFIGGEVSVGIALGISHPECPAAKLIAGVGGLADFDAPIVGVGEGDFCGLANGNRYRLHGGVKFPIGIVCGNLFGVIGSFLQTRNRNRTICPGGEWRAGNRGGAGSIRVQPDLPVGQVFTSVGFLYQLHAAGVQFVIEGDQSGAAAGNGYFLGIGAGTGVQRMDGTVHMPQLLHKVSASGQPGNGEITAAVGGERSGDQTGAGSICVNAELPAGKILTVLGGFGQADIS